MSDPEDFYIGYLDHAPAPLSRFLRRVALLLILVAVPLFGLLASVQQPQPSGRFEFGVYRDFEGVLYTEPLPYLRVSDPQSTATPVRTLLLVGFGKHGIPQEARALSGQRVSFKGSVIEREGLTMVEMNDLKSIRGLGEPRSDQQRGKSETIGQVSLKGELVDTKCWLGVMRPATGKVHRACAIRCLEGGIPPGLLIREESGAMKVFPLVAPKGGPAEFDLQWAAREVAVEGMLELLDGLPILRVTSIKLS
jgi:hypothetical protein